MRPQNKIWHILRLALFLLIIILLIILAYKKIDLSKEPVPEKESSLVPDYKKLLPSPENDLILYGRDIIANTSKYFGPVGSISHSTNGLNCQNCHADAGSRLYCNNFLAVASTYPKYRPRSGKIESIEYRVNECLQRSLNGNTIDSLSKEMRAMVAYIKWLGQLVEKNTKNEAVGAIEIKYIDRAADTLKGELVYNSRCASCHGRNGEGSWSADSNAYRYPPVWGEHSYVVSAGMYRIQKLAGFVRNNMPIGATKQAPLLNNEECWDVAAYINSKPHPIKLFAYDWPDISKKPPDYPFGPYADTFSLPRHKYGPYKDMSH